GATCSGRRRSRPGRRGRAACRHGEAGHLPDLTSARAGPALAMPHGVLAHRPAFLAILAAAAAGLPAIAAAEPEPEVELETGRHRHRVSVSGGLSSLVFEDAELL